MFQKWSKKKLHSIPHDSSRWHLDFESVTRRHCVAHGFISISYRLKPAYSAGWSLSYVTFSEFFNWTTFTGIENCTMCIHPFIPARLNEGDDDSEREICFITWNIWRFSRSRSHKSLLWQRNWLHIFSQFYPKQTTPMTHIN